MDSISSESKGIGNEIRKLRKQRGLSSTELAQRTGLSQPQVSRLENGKQGFRSETLARISKALDVTPAYFFLHEAEYVRQENSASVNERRELGRGLEEDLLRQYGEVAVSPGFRGIVMRLARALTQDNVEMRALRRLLDRILTMNNEERWALFQMMNSPQFSLPAVTTKAPEVFSEALVTEVSENPDTFA